MPEQVTSGRIVAPAAGAVIATLATGGAALQAGYYDITVHASVGGAAVGDQDNMKLQFNGADKVNPIPSGLSGLDAVTTFHYQQIDGVNPIQVVAVAAGTAGVVYECTIEVNRVG